MNNKKDELVVAASNVLLEELRADIKAGIIKDPRLLMLFGRGTFLNPEKKDVN